RVSPPCCTSTSITATFPWSSKARKIHAPQSPRASPCCAKHSRDSACRFALASFSERETACHRRSHHDSAAIFRLLAPCPVRHPCLCRLERLRQKRGGGGRRTRGGGCRHRHSEERRQCGRCCRGHYLGPERYRQQLVLFRRRSSDSG